MDTNGKVNPMTLQVDLGLDSADPVRKFCTLSYGEEHLDEANTKSKGKSYDSEE